VVLLALVACGGGGGGGTTGPSTAPTFPNLVGEYTGVWTQDVSADGGRVQTVDCPSTFTVVSQTGGNFYGRSTVSPPCSEGLFLRGAGGVMGISEGQVTSAGQVSFRFSDDVRTQITITGGCSVAPMPPFVGSFSGNTLTASRTENYDCRGGGNPQFSFAIRLTARK
jgi:hypothetical protein